MKKKRKGNIVDCGMPLFVTIAGAPANRSPWRVVRSDKLDEFSTNLRGAAKVKRVDSLVSVTLPTGLDDDAIEDFESVYGITDEAFERVDTDGVTKYVRRGEMPEGEVESMVMKRGETIEIVKRSDIAEEPAVTPTEVVEVTEEEPVVVDSLMVARIRFDPEIFTTDEALDWAASNGLGVFSVATRGDVITLTQPHAIDINELEFTGTVPAAGVIIDGCSTAESTKRADDYEVLMLTNREGVVPFGSYGWDSSTFLEALADKEYTCKINDGLDLLSDTLRNIMKWQWQLTPSEAKAFMESSLDGAKWYFGNLLDSLPQNAVQRSDLNIGENNMALDKSDETRIAEIVDAAMQKREDAAAAKAKEQADIQKRADDEAKSEARIAKLEADLAAEKQAREDAEAASQSSSEQRSDDDDNTIVDGETVVDKEDTAKKTERSDEEIFAGAFGGIADDAE